MGNLLIPVLALNNDIDSPCYVTRNMYWANAEEFMKSTLCKPHDVEYKIKNINLLYLNSSLACNKMGVEEMFLHLTAPLASLTERERKKRDKAFDFFWEINEEVLYVY